LVQSKKDDRPDTWRLDRQSKGTTKMIRLTFIGITICLLAGMAFPYMHEAYEWHRVGGTLDPIMSDQDRAAFRAWQGDAVSFARTLYARCEITYGDRAAGHPG
jgi:hypothetical protein